MSAQETETAKRIGKIHIADVRLSHAYLFQPYVGKPSLQNPNPQPRFKLNALLPPDHPELKKIAATIEAVGAAHQWKKKLPWATIKAQLKAQDKICLHKGDITNAGMPEYAGLFFLAASSEKRPTIIDGDRTPLTAQDGRPYSGSYANVIVNIWAQDNEYGMRVNATLTGVQHVRHGDSFGGGAAPASVDEFGIVAGAADEAAPAGEVDDLLG